MVLTLPTYCENPGVSKEKPCLIGMIENTLSVDSVNKVVKSVLELVMPLMNFTCFDIKDIPTDMMTSELDENFYVEDAHILFMPMDTSAFGSFKYLINTAWMDSSDSLIVSKVPKKYETSVSTLISCQEEVKWLFAVTLPGIALCATIIPRLLRVKSAPFHSVFYKKIWNVISPFLDQGMVHVEKYVSTRILLGSWLWATMVIGIYLTSFMRSKLSAINYETIDNLMDLLDHKDTLPVMLLNVADYRVLRKDAEIDESSRKLLNIMKSNPNSLVDLPTLFTDTDFYKAIQDGSQALVTHHRLWKCLFDIVEHSPDARYYYSTTAISPGVMTLFYNNTLSTADQEISNRLVLRIAESKCIDQILAFNTYLMEKTTWHPDTESLDEPTSFKDVALLVWFILLSLVATFLIQTLELFLFKSFAINSRLYSSVMSTLHVT